MRRHVLLLILPLLPAPLAGCAERNADAAPAAEVAAAPDTALLGAEALRMAGVRVEPVSAATWRPEWSLPGRLGLDPATTQTLGSIVEGRVMRVLVLPGDRVRTGQVLATLHSHEMLDALGARGAARAALAQAENDLRLAESVAARAERLYAAKAASLADLERARAALVDARAQLERERAESRRAEEMVAHLVGDGPMPPGVDAHEVLLRSPIDGVVVERVARPGQVATVGTPLLTVSDLRSLVLSVGVGEAAAGAVRPGTVVTFGVQAYPGREWTARVTRVAPVLDPATRTLEVTAAVADSTGELRPEMFATARLQGGDAGPALVVPAAAVQALEGDTVLLAAFPRGAGLHVRAVPVRIGRRTEKRAEVLSGVEAGTRVVVEGAAIVKAEILRRREAGSEAP